MAYFDVEESFYFEQKLAQLKALDPALYGNWEVAQVQDAFAEAGLSAQEHFDQYGWAEELSANATFDVAKYLAAKAAQLNDAAYEGKTDWTSADVVAAFKDAGLSAEAHFTQYGEAEGLEAQPVEGAPSTLTEALANLKAAQDAKTAFLLAAGQDEEVEGEEPAATETDLATAVTTAEANLAANDFATDASYDANDSSAVKAQKLEAAKILAKAEITAAEAAVAKAEEAVAKKAGLAAAVQTLETREKSLEAAEAVEVTAKSDEAAAVSALKVLATAAEAAASAALAAAAPGSAAATAAQANLDAIQAAMVGTTPDAKGEVAGLLSVDADGKLVLAKGLTDATVKAAAEKLLQATNARLNAEANVAAIEKAIDDAELAIEFIDFKTGDKDALAALVIPTATTQAQKDALTLAQVKDKLTKLMAAASDELVAGKKLEFNADGSIKNPATDFEDEDSGNSAVLDAHTAVITALNAYESTLTSTEAASSVLATAKQDLEDAEEDLADLEALIAAVDAANEAVANLESLDNDIATALAALKELGFEAPVTLQGTSEVATGGDDLYLVSTADTQIINFGSEGADKLFIGNTYTLNTGALTAGDNAVLEVFFIQDGANAKVVLETKAYGSNEASVAETVVTLAGVKAADLTLDADGFVALA